MKKYICILAGTALLAACEQKTETVAPAASPASTPEAAANAAEPTNSTPPPASESPAGPGGVGSLDGSTASPTP